MRDGFLLLMSRNTLPVSLLVLFTNRHRYLVQDQRRLEEVAGLVRWKSQLSVS